MSRPCLLFSKTSLSFQQLNPEYFSNITLEMRQPLLRGFGIDYNQAFIVIAKNDRRISHLAFKRQIRDTLLQVEELYWRLVQARRDVVITARPVCNEGLCNNVTRDFPSSPLGGVTLHNSVSVGYKSINPTGWLHRDPAVANSSARLLGGTMIMGTRVERSHPVHLPQCCFSPRCQP